MKSHDKKEARIWDFQRATAERIVHIFKDLGHRRVLLADEVGLGKTFVAREVVNLVRQWHKKDGDDFFKVVYVCPNANIAGQNIEKLGVQNRMSVSDSRLTMQHLLLAETNLENREKTARGGMPESIIPLTPATSFSLSTGKGTVFERGLMLDLLLRMPEFRQHDEKLREFFRCGVKWMPKSYDERIDKCGPDYIEHMRDELRSKLSDELKSKIIEAAQNGTEGAERTEIIGALRRIFAEISVGMLDPDLIIMDEFQRFDSLLQQSDDEMSMLTRRFFDDSRANTKILLLSATPYRPYSTLEDLNTDGRDGHYRDFMKVMDFLFVSKDRADGFKLTWQNYSNALKQTDGTDLAPLLAAKSEAEDALYGVMCRTERFNSGIIDDSGVRNVTVLPEDVTQYAQMRNMMDRLKSDDAEMGHLPMDYVKSSPYLLSFMDKYELKRDIVGALRKSDGTAKFKTDALLIKKADLDSYRDISPANGKLKMLHDMVFGERREKRAHQLLWMPASNPYYKAGGMFETEEARSFSKILLFSAWEMVPRMVSVMMSYWAEAYVFGKLNEKQRQKGKAEHHYFQTESRRMGNRLRDNGILTYPCRALADLFSAEEYYGWELPRVKSAIKTKISQLLKANAQTANLQRRDSDSARQILNIMRMLDGETVDKAESVFRPDNAIDVLTDIAIASPAICAMRISEDAEAATKVGQAFVKLFNKPESTAVIDSIYDTRKNDEDYYESVLDYCVKGNLRAVIEEFAHVCDAKEKLGELFEEAILDTSNLDIDTKDTLTGNKKTTMRCHFAIPFIDKSVTDKSVLRTQNIRKAFNSPFRPFVLSTTSVGQEGLDFHLYARKIVHWNLPSNPVDLEQREGRINRFKSLAIRRNVAMLAQKAEFQTWEEMFEAVGRELKGDNSDMVPYWCLPTEGLAEERRARLQKIERIVPLYPMSLDHGRYDRLIKVLTLYRMTLGQPRQEELVEMFERMGLAPEQLRQLTIDLCPFNRGRA